MSEGAQHDRVEKGLYVTSVGGETSYDALMGEGPSMKHE